MFTRPLKKGLGWRRHASMYSAKISITRSPSIFISCLLSLWQFRYSFGNERYTSKLFLIYCYYRLIYACWILVLNVIPHTNTQNIRLLNNKTLEEANEGQHITHSKYDADRILAQNWSMDTYFKTFYKQIPTGISWTCIF